jgi:hypothetical protein
VSLPSLPFVSHLSGFQRCIPATTLMSVVSDMPLPILYPRKSGCSCCFITNGFRRQPDWPPVELAAGLVHTIRHVTCHAWASPSAWCLHPYFCCFQSLTLCVFFNFCLYNPWCCCIPYFGVDTGSSSGPLLGRPPPLNPTLALHLITGHPLTLILGTVCSGPPSMAPLPALYYQCYIPGGL